MRSMKLSLDEFRDRCQQVFEAAGYQPAEAEATAREVADAEARGIDSHGASIIPEIVEWGEHERGEPKVEKENPVSAFIRGNGTIGPLVAEQAMDLAMEKAEEAGIGIVGVNNRTPFITAGYHPRRAAENGVIGMNWSAANSKVALHGSADPLIGTNPLGIGIPADGFPLVLDMAVTKTAAADIRKADRAGEEIAEGWAVDEDGAPTTDPAEAIAGAMLPMGEHKGSGLGVMIELLGGAWVGGKTGTDVDGNRGMVFLAMQKGLFVSNDQFRERMESFVEEVHGAEPRHGFEKVMLPGEPEEQAFQSSVEHGIEIEEDVIEQLRDLDGW